MGDIVYVWYPCRDIMVKTTSGPICTMRNQIVIMGVIAQFVNKWFCKRDNMYLSLFIVTLLVTLGLD